MMSNKKLYSLKEFFIRCRKLNVSLCFLTQSYLVFQKIEITLYTLYNFKLNNKRELQNTAINHSSDIDYKEFVKFYRDDIHTTF